MKKRILIVEDDLVTQHLLRNMLAEAGYYISSVMDGIEIQSDKNILNVDLILLDMMIPHLYESSELIEIYKDLKAPIIVMSSIDKDDGEYFTKKINANSFFKKPLDHKGLLNKVHSILKTTTLKTKTF